MPKKKGSRRIAGSDLKRVDAHVVRPHEYRELPQLTEKMLARGRVNQGGRSRMAQRPSKGQSR